MCRLPLQTIILTAILILHLAIAICGSMPTIDDAFISFRYARNLTTGHGLVFNPSERVEGYTNFLWVMLIATGMQFVNPVLLSKILGVLCSLLLLMAFFRTVRRISPTKMAWMPLLYVTLDPSLIAWSTRGLETSLFTLLMWLAFQSASDNAGDGRNPRAIYRSAVTASLAFLTRPEGILALMFYPLCSPGFSDRRNHPRTLRFAATALALILPYLLFKFVYFGHLLPNTFAAKTGGGSLVLWRGAAYIVQGWDWPEIILLTLTLVSLPRLIRTCNAGRVERSALAASAFVLIFLVYILAVGGDSLGPDRFLAPLIPFLIFAAAVGIHRPDIGPAHPTLPGRIAVAALLVALCLNAWPLIRQLEEPDIFSMQKELNHPGTRAGLCLARNARSGDSVATSVIGRIPYYSGLYTLDVFGLIDPVIARQQRSGMGTGAAGHEKSDWDYILSRKPVYITGQELIVAPPQEPGWMKRIRERIQPHDTGATVKQPGIPAPPYPGYHRIALNCDNWTLRIWRRDPGFLIQQDNRNE
ncbi:hypothetical protein JW823_04890 [bacterium]|nr:hypothetical protein [candidate division CSSED10-310 bacterium]